MRGSNAIQSGMELVVKVVDHSPLQSCTLSSCAGLSMVCCSCSGFVNSNSRDFVLTPTPWDPANSRDFICRCDALNDSVILCVWINLSYQLASTMSLSNAPGFQSNPRCPAADKEERWMPPFSTACVNTTTHHALTQTAVDQRRRRCRSLHCA